MAPKSSLRLLAAAVSPAGMAPRCRKCGAEPRRGHQAADAKYLEAPDVEGRRRRAEDRGRRRRGRRGQGDPMPQEISQGAVKAVLSYTEEKSEDGETMRAPVVIVFANGKEIAKLEGDAGFGSPPVSVQIAEIDPGNQTPRSVVSFYTGGAHCCSDTSVVTSSADGSAWTDRRCRRVRRRPAARDRSQRRRALRVQDARQRLPLCLRLLCLLGGAARSARASRTAPSRTSPPRRASSRRMRPISRR